MRVRKAIHLGLSLLVAAGLGVSAAQVEAQTASQKKSSSTKSGSSSHRAKSSKRSRRARGQKAPTPDRISEIQQALAKDGSFTGNPNGKWDASTIDSLKKFQESHGLNPTGKLDAKTLQQLGLGSSTAGAAAPLPPISSSALKAPPSQTGQRQ
jgi:peptidoglycan hydrolase-like protein with peptidoglycan-binding domain